MRNAHRHQGRVAFLGYGDSPLNLEAQGVFQN